MSSIEILSLTASSAELDDAAHLFDQYRQFYGQSEQLPLCRQFLMDRLLRGESVVLLATVNGQAAGFVQLYPGFSSIACCSTMILNDLFVAGNHRSAGVGRRLVEATIRLASARGAARIQLETAQGNASARALYEQLGFEQSTGFLSYALNLGSPSPNAQS